MNLVGHNIELIKELKTHTLKRLEMYNKYGFIKEEKYEELVKLETDYLDDRLKMMESFL
ncbi:MULTISPECIES: hypothetical protein [Paenibacillus]|uniref:Uncharacterized protein n=1 Tax=Paenibacillus peoriae TaxID=59893 RepID=A0A7H0Y1W0_9BACL|nr:MULTISPECIES: hypothetical protein [Paenibacillus]QNR65068.1 hypothetical protein IAQ67_14135 [Paenibacillus peoriae]